jgi:hypothetical protein
MEHPIAFLLLLISVDCQTLEASFPHFIHEILNRTLSGGEDEHLAAWLVLAK